MDFGNPDSNSVEQFYSPQTNPTTLEQNNRITNPSDAEELAYTVEEFKDSPLEERMSILDEKERELQARRENWSPREIVNEGVSTRIYEKYHHGLRRMEIEPGLEVTVLDSPRGDNPLEEDAEYIKNLAFGHQLEEKVVRDMIRNAKEYPLTVILSRHGYLKLDKIDHDEPITQEGVTMIMKELIANSKNSPESVFDANIIRGRSLRGGDKTYQVNTSYPEGLRDLRIAPIQKKFFSLLCNIAEDEGVKKSVAENPEDVINDIIAEL